MKKIKLCRSRNSLCSLKKFVTVLVCICYFACPDVSFAGIAENAQQSFRVRGTVADDSGEPLIGVSVKVKGVASIGTVTNLDGQYTLDLPDKSARLTFSYIGYETIEEAVAGRSIVNITLTAEVGELEEVTVVGYGTQKKVSVSGSIAAIPPTELQKVATTSLPNAISGKLPGVMTRQTSGEPGFDAATVYIRGMATFNNKAPLILVDGVERDMSNISMEEVESFSVLKDASATAVYGVRGANGVIIITTKKGKLGKPQISLRLEGARLNNLSTRNYINGYEYALLMNEGYRHVGQPNFYSEEELEKFRTGSDPYLYPNVDWISETLKEHSYQSINNLSISGGSDLIRYYTNIGYSVQDGIFVEDPSINYDTNANMQRINYRSNVDISLSKTFSIEVGIGGIIDDRRYPGGGSSAIMNALQNTSPILFPVKNPDGSPGGSPVYAGSNPWANATQSGYSDDRICTIQSTFGAKWDLSSITPGLSIGGKYAYDFYTYDKMLRYKQFAVREYLGKDPGTGEDMYNEVRPELPLGTPDNSQTRSNRASYLEGVINYDRTFGVHGVTAMLLYNQRNYVNLKPNDEISSLPQRNQGLAGRVTYNYNNTYFAEFNAGYNGSENFPKGQRMGFFPSVSLGYLISNESFWKIPFVDFFKIRGSYGQAGNDLVNGQRFLYLTTINTEGAGQDYYWGGAWYRGYVENKMGNPNITWEVATKANLGVDLHVWNNKISLQVDVFHEDRDNILLPREGSIPWFAGFQSVSVPYGNLGKVTNQGMDGLLEFHDKTSSGLSYSFRTNFSYAHNEVIENDEPTPLYANESGIGHRLSQPFGLIAEGFFTSEEDIDSWYDQTQLGGRPRIGDIKYRDVNGNGVIDPHDVTAIGYARDPEIMFGFGGTLAYKGFDFSIYFTGAANTSTFFEGRSFYPFEMGSGAFNMYKEYYDNRWIPDESLEYNLANAKYPAATDGANANNFRRSTVWQKDASYLRLKNMELGYTLPGKLVNRVSMSNVRVFANGTNLYTWDRINSVIDAESDNWYPIQMALNFGIQINF